MDGVPRGTGGHEARDGHPAPGPGTPVDERTSRLAELVTGLTGCPPTGALHVLRTDTEPTTDALELVARAMVRVDAPPDPSLRLTGYVRDDDDDDDDAGPGSPADPRTASPADRAAGSASASASASASSDHAASPAAPAVGTDPPDRLRLAPWVEPTAERRRADPEPPGGDRSDRTGDEPDAAGPSASSGPATPA